MRALFRILIACATIAFIGFMFFNSVNENEPLRGPNADSNVIPQTEFAQPLEGAVTRPQKGLSTLIGQGVGTVLKQYGEPSRKEPSSFGYDWWVYNTNAATFFMVGVQNDIVTQVYIAGVELDASPFKIGQTRDEIYRMTIIDYEVVANVDDNIFIFSMSEEDLQTRLLIRFEGIFAQLYLDGETGELQGVRYTDSRTLVMHQPYEMTYQGELVTPTPPSSFLQKDINTASAAQLNDLINITRVHHEMEPLKVDKSLEEAARKHSEDMKIQNFLAHESPTNGDLKQRLKVHEISFSDANENLATAYLDAIEAMHGWLNSPEHRKVIMNDKYTEVGSGVFLNYYTQIFIEPSNDKVNSEKEEHESSDEDANDIAQ